MGLNRRLSLKDVEDIKRLIWEGEYYQADIARAFSVSQATISRIAGGTQWPMVPWPDGEVGALNIEDWSRRRYKKVQPITIAEVRRIRARREPYVPTKVHVEAETQDSSSFGDEQQSTPSGAVGDDPEPERDFESEKRRLDEEGAAILSELSKSMEDIIREGVGESSAAAVKTATKIEGYEALEWSNIVSRLKGSKREGFVLEAEKDEKLKKACCIVFKGIPQAEWFSPVAKRLIETIMEGLEDG